MKKMTGRFIAVGMAAAMVLTAMVPAGTSDAAAKPKLATKKITVEVKKSKTIGIKKKKNFKISFKSKNKKIATVSAKGKVTGKKKGTTKITVSYKKGKARNSNRESDECEIKSRSEANECGSSDAFPGTSTFPDASSDWSAFRRTGRAGYHPAA